MRLPTEPRVWGERALRTIGVGALLLACWHAWFPEAARVVRAAPSWSALPDAAVLAQSLASPSRVPRWLSLAGVPELEQRALLQAGVHAGVTIAWRAADGATMPALAVSAEGSADPAGGVVVRAAAPDGVALELADSLGWLDSTTSAAGGVSWRVPGAVRRVQVRHGATGAWVQPTARDGTWRVRLYGTPGWESRFTTVALEEAGWEVDAAFTIAPRVTVQSGRPQPLDTARYRLVVALDSSAWGDAASIGRFVRSGGGLVLFPDAADGAPTALPVAGRVGGLNAAVPGALRTASPLNGVPLRAISGLVPGAVVLERSARPGAPVQVAARVVGAGRVVQVGVSGLWEWRMLGGDDAVDAHRDWWRVLLQRAAPSPPPPAVAASPSPLPGDVAPLADLVARVGPANATPEAEPERDRTVAAPPGWLLLVALLALLGEWWSRRLRGAR